MTVDSVATPPEPPRLRWLRWTAVLVAVVVVGTGAVFGARLNKDPTVVDSPLVGTIAPDRDLPYLERGGTFSLSQLRGQVVVVNFWATWCLPCREEHPALTAAATAYRAEGVRFVGILYQDRSAPATAFLDELGRGRDYVYLTDPGSRMAIDFGVFGIPETFFVDRQGKIAAKITGPSTLPLLSGTLDTVLAGQTADTTVQTGPVQSAPR